MDEKRQSCETLLENARRTFVFSGYQAVWGVADQTYSLAQGVTRYWPGFRVIDESTLFDIGSVTKSVVGASLLGRALESRRLELEAPVGKYLPAIRGSWIEPLSLSHLASHSAGLVDWVPIYLRAKAPSDFLPWVMRSEAELRIDQPGKRAVYSDIGYLILSEVLRNVFGDLQSAFQKEVAGPLALKETLYRPPNVELTAATEVCRWRQRLVQGEVFDENCAYLGGVTAHAGLFSTARGLAPWCREWLAALQGRSAWLSKEVAQKLTEKSQLAPGSSWGFGFDTKSAAGSSAGNLFSEKSFGHLGYPGASVWIDPQAQGFAILWTNRVHPSRVDERIRALRPRFHDAIAAYWSKS